VQRLAFPNSFSVFYLFFCTGPHLVDLNEGLRELYEKHGVRVVSAVEGLSTQLAPVLPKVLIVPEVSMT
jgi:hypothetical protein